MKKRVWCAVLLFIALLCLSPAARAQASQPRLTIEQSTALAQWAVEDGARLVAKDTDQSLIARLKRWWQKEEAAPVELEDESISEEKLEDTRKSVDALLN